MTFMHGPFEVELKIRCTDGERSAIVTYTMPVGALPEKEAIKSALTKALEELQKNAGPGWRLQTRNEFENEVISDRTGGMAPRFATKDEWDEA